MKSVNDTGMKRAALINDLSCLGKCSLSVALPILSAAGVEAVALPTAILSTHTGGFDGYVMRDMTEEMQAFIAHWQHIGVHFDCIYTGFFSSVRQIEIARQFIQDFAQEDTLVLVDPVLGDNGRLYGCFSPDYVQEMRALCKLAHIITPNLTEAALLTGSSPDDSPEAILSRLETPNAVITSVPGGEDEIGYLARLNGRVLHMHKPKLSLELHGCGDVFASALCAQLLNDQPLPNALQKAADFCDGCIRKTAQRQPGHWYGLTFEDMLKGQDNPT